MARLIKLISGLAALSTAVAGPILRRGTVGNSDIVGLAQSVPSTTAGTLYLKYKPYLYRQSGCDPYPAVDADGNTNEGLSPTGSPSGDCLDSTGQIYVRSETYNGAFAIMYSWYWPKDEPSAVLALFGVGHRHDWEAIVVWLSDATTSATLLGVAASAHGDFSTTTSPSTSGAGGPLVEYYSNGVLDHSLEFTSTVGDQQPLVAWESLGSTIQDALADTDWGDANVPFIDSHFESNLAEAEL